MTSWYTPEHSATARLAEPWGFLFVTNPVRLDVERFDLPSDLRPLHDAVRRARRVLWQTQRPDGSWDSMGEMGAMPTSQVVVSLHFLGRLDREDAVEAARWIRAQQRKDGSFVLYPFADKGDVGATASAWAALHVAEPAGSAEAIERARRWLDKHGGTDRVLEWMETGDVSAVYLAMAGLLDPKRLPCPMAIFSLVPPVMRALETRFHSGVLMMALQLNVLVRRLRGDFGPDGKDLGLIARAECRKAIELLETFQNQEGSWNANTVQTAIALPALHAAGLPIDDDRIQRGVAWLQSLKERDADGVRFHVFSSGVWCTAFDLRALFASGVPPCDPRVARALEYLLECQLTIPQPEVDNRNPGARRTGGWAFQKGNHTMADCDDAGVVFSAFGPALAHKGDSGLDPALAQRLRRSVKLGTDWLFGMQNPDGGWSAFVWNLPPKKPGSAMTETVRAKLEDPLAMLRFLFDPQIALGDPSTEDLTSRILHGLGNVGLTVESSPEVRRAVEFLKKQQCESGSFWGRWVVNHLAATSFVLMGLRAVGVDMLEPWVQRAVRWVMSHQNPDGGWGEGVDSYPNPKRAGIGPSMAPLTGLVIQALLDAGEGDSKAVERGVAYLVARQNPDGTWPNDDYLHANVPPDTYYYLPEATKYYPLEALARYLAFRKHPPAPAPERWSNAQLDAARQRTDLRADRVVSSIFAQGELAAVNDLLGKMFRSDAPIPEGLPPEARAYFDATDLLPAWADRAQIATAQRLFSRAGWEVATSLFCSSLPQAYAAANGAHVLTQTGGMTKHIRQRIFETAQFLFDVLDEGGLEPSGRGIRAAQKIRLMHAAIRHLLITRPKSWDGGRFGLPVNQEDLAGTLLTFSVITLDGIRRLGVEVSAEEAQAWIHTWNAIGTVLGVEEELLARDVPDAHALMDAIRERQWARSTDGRALVRPLIRLMQDFIPGEVFDGIPVALVRHLAGDHCADLLGLPSTDWTRIFIDVAGVADPLVDFGVRELGLEKIFARVRQQIMHGIVNIEREGKQARFRIPSSLRHTLDPV